MPQQLTPPGGQGEGEEPFKPFDRQALEATLADALRDAESATAPGPTDSQAPDTARRDRSRPRPQVGDPAARRSDGPRAEPAIAGGQMAAASPQPAPRPTLLGSGLTGPAGLLGGSTLGASTRPAAAPGPGASPLAVPSRPLAAPGPLASPGKLISGLSPAPAGYAPTADSPAVEQPTIPIRRPKRSEPSAPAAPAPPAPMPTPAAQPRPAITIAAWSPSDDDILPRSGSKRRARRR